MEKDVSGIILVAGSSTRYGKGVNKNFEKIHGRSVLSYSLRVLMNHPKIQDLVLVIREEDFPIVQAILSQEELTKPLQIVVGGKTRQESVHHALIRTDSSYVLIHDGARPGLQESFIDSCLSFIPQYQGIIVGVKSKDTIKIVNSAGEIVSSTNRNHTWLAQTPQCFDRELLLRLHEKYKGEEGITDDAMLLEKEGIPVRMVEGDYKNIKITTIEDLEIAKRYLKKI